MAPVEIANALAITPFEPFRLILSSGNNYDIDAPHRVIVGNRYVHIGVPANPGDEFADRTIRLDLLHVTELIPLRPPQQLPHGNGQAAS